MLTAITTKEESRDAFKALCCTLKSAADRKDGDRLIFREGFWVRLIEYKNRFGCSCGILINGNPTSTICEINPAKQDPDFMYVTMFAREDKNVYLCHTGNISIGRTQFTERYNKKSVPINIKEREESIYVIGKINDHYLPIDIYHFICEVYRIKEEYKIENEISGDIPQQIDPDSFKPEFSGARRSYSSDVITKPDVKHGSVVMALRNAILQAKREPYNDKHRDMFVKDNNHQISVLFEIKTKTETTDIYQAIGQLMFHGRARRAGVKIVLVIPDKPKKCTAMRLDQLEIKILRYKWKKEKPVFHQDDVEQLLL